MVEMTSKPKLDSYYPSDWKQLFVGDLVSITTGSRNTQDNNPEGLFPFFVRSQKVERIDGYSFDKEAVLTAGDGVGTGKIFHYINGKFDAHQRVYVLSNFVDELHGKYFYWQFSNLFFDRIMSMTAKSSVDSVRQEMISRMSFPLPCIKEQQAIADALSDADVLIASIEKLIEKKQNIFSGLKTELFKQARESTNYEMVELGKILSYEQPKNYIVQNSQLNSTGKVPVLTANKAFILGYTEEMSGIKSDLPIIIFDDFTTDKKFVDFKFKVRSSAIKLLSARSIETDVYYVYSAMEQIDFPVIDHKRYWIAEYQKIQIPLPNSDKQRQVALTLLDFESEIKSLYGKLYKAKKVKAGMVQELLTGRTRLV